VANSATSSPLLDFQPTRRCLRNRVGRTAVGGEPCCYGLNSLSGWASVGFEFFLREPLSVIRAFGVRHVQEGLLQTAHVSLPEGNLHFKPYISRRGTFVGPPVSDLICSLMAIGPSEAEFRGTPRHKQARKPRLVMRIPAMLLTLRAK
jgi:hypothetical protein